MIRKILYITHYGSMPKSFYCDPETGQPKKIIGDGGSNIHIHLLQHLFKQGHQVTFSTFKPHYQYQAFFGRSPKAKYNYFWTPELILGKYNFFLDNLYKIFFLPLKAFFDQVNGDLMISSTDFLPDVFYAFLLKVKSPKIKWAASYFLEAPKPWAKDNPYKTSFGRWLVGLVYWLEQRLAYQLIKSKADFVLVTSYPDVKRFVTTKRPAKKIIIVQGGVDIEAAQKYLKSRRAKTPEKRRYDACFLGRFHYQKGVLELVDIWAKVCQTIPQAKLAMIGNGPLEKAVKQKIKRLDLEKNIDLLGYQTGSAKYRVFRNAKMIVHPATYDSGGMAAAEGMAWGLPAVGFDLEALKTYYPTGMIKTPPGDLQKFAANILLLLADKKLYRKMAQEAVVLTQKVWDWRIRTGKIYQKLFDEK